MKKLIIFLCFFISACGGVKDSSEVSNKKEVISPDKAQAIRNCPQALQQLEKQGYKINYNGRNKEKFCTYLLTDYYKHGGVEYYEEAMSALEKCPQQTELLLKQGFKTQSKTASESCSKVYRESIDWIK